MRLASRGISRSTAACCWLLLAHAASAEPPAARGPAASPVAPPFSVLFNGRDLKGWQPGSGWKVADGALSTITPQPPIRRETAPGVSTVVAGGYQGDPDLHYSGRLPGDCEIVFEWRELGQRAAGAGPSSSAEIAYNRGEYPGAAIDYLISQAAIRLHVRGPHAPPFGAGLSGIMRLAASKDFSVPAGQWNSSRIVCRATGVQFWLNGKLAQDLDLATLAKGWKRDDARPNPAGLAAVEWLEGQPKGVYLTVVAPQAETPAAPRVQIRSLSLRPLQAATPAVIKPDQVVGSVYGKPITAGDIGLQTPIDPAVRFDARDRARWDLMERIMRELGGPVLERFVKEHKIEATKDEIESVKRRLRELRVGDVDDKFATQLILPWKLQRELHRAYGGRVIFQQAGPEALDAMRRLFEEAEKKGDLKFADPGVRHMFYYYSNMQHTFSDAKALEQPWFFDKQD